MSEVHYIRNDIGAVHSVDHDHFEEYCHTWSRGRPFLKPGFTEITEEEARAANPQLFGKRDPNIKRTAEELRELKLRKEWERELRELEDEFE